MHLSMPWRFRPDAKMQSREMPRGIHHDDD